MADEGMPAYYETSSSAAHLKSLGIGNDHIVTANELNDNNTAELSGTAATVGTSNSNLPNTIEDIKDSSLLTEDDLLLLDLTLDWTPTTHSYTYTSHMMISLSVLIVALISYTVPLLYGLCVLIIVIVGLAVYKLNKKRLENNLMKQYGQLKTCIQDIESLLILLMKSLQTIKEREIVYRGFTRSSKGVHLTEGYQCPTLRKRIDEICTNGRVKLHSITRILIEQYQLNIELDRKESHMAYRTIDTNSDLSCIDNLKNCASLFAISNSEMLCRLALVLGAHIIPLSYNTRLSLTEAVQLIEPFNSFISQSICELQWSLKHENQYLLKEERPGGIKLTIDGLNSISDDLHVADLHVHTTLIKIRELNNTDTTIHGIHDILNNINTAQYHLKQVLKKHSPPANINTSNNEDDEVLHERDEEINEIIENDNQSANDEEEEEKIYEAYVNSIDQLSLLEQKEPLDNEEWKKTTLSILNELKSVLMNRKLQKEKTKEKMQSHDCHMTSLEESHQPATDEESHQPATDEESHQPATDEESHQPATDDVEESHWPATDEKSHHMTNAMDSHNDLFKAISLFASKQKSEDIFEE